MVHQSRTRFRNTLLKNGWEVISVTSKKGLKTETSKKGKTEVVLLPDHWEMYRIVEGESTFGVSNPYGPRQSQELRRAIDRFRKWEG
jgi:hypothetical protein